jgi:NitT/TauT family transport system permease protein
MTVVEAGAPATAPRPPSWEAPLRSAVRVLAVPVVTVLIWYPLSWTVFVVPAPQDTVRALIANLGSSEYRADFLVTLEKTMLAFVIASAVGLAVGTVLGLVKPLRDFLQPLVLIVNGIPKIVLYPVLLIIFGLNAASQVTMGTIFGTLPVLVNVMAALVSMPPVYQKVARTLGTGPLRAMVHVYLPAVAPMLLVALQLGFGLSVLGVVYAELIASNNGLGQRLIESYSVGAYPAMAATILAILAIALGGTGTFRWLQRLVGRHR